MFGREGAEFCESVGVFSAAQIIITQQAVRCWIVTQLLFGVCQDLFCKRLLPLAEIETRESNTWRGGFGREVDRRLKFTAPRVALARLYLGQGQESLAEKVLT